MKISCHNSKRSLERGGVLVVALIFAVVWGIALVSYLLLASQEHREVSRAQTWNSSLALAESGVEEALAQINASPGNFSVNSWGSPGGSTYGPVTRTLTNGSYCVSISVVGGVPTIYATGFVSVASTSQKVSRKVKVTVTSQQVSPFSVGLGAVDNINMNGNGASSDSWNSHINGLSTNGTYNSSLTSSNGDVGSINGVVNIGNHTIEGNLYLGPNATYTSGTNQITGTIYYDYNIQFPDVTLPTTDTNGNSISWQTVPTSYTYATNITSSGHGANTVYTTNITATATGHTITSTGYYTVNDSADITVNPGVTVTLDVKTNSFTPNNVNLNGGMTNSGSVVIYQESGSISLAGNSGGGAVNGRPENFVVFGMTNVTSITLSGNSSFIGAVYAPEATLTLNGGGNANNLQGSVIVNSVTLNGHYDFHYDLALANWILGVNRGYIPVSWQEL